MNISIDILYKWFNNDEDDITSLIPGVQKKHDDIISKYLCCNYIKNLKNISYYIENYNYEEYFNIINYMSKIDNVNIVRELIKFYTDINYDIKKNKLLKEEKLKDKLLKDKLLKEKLH